MAIGHPYNGWSEIIRYARDKHYYHAQRRKILPQEPICRCCNNEMTGPCIPYHSEDYGPTLEDYWSSCVQLCHRCHGMVHARLKTPNRWKRLLTQIVNGEIDEAEFPVGKNVVGMLSKFRSREDTAEFVPMPDGINEYCLSLSLDEYNGPLKAATLLVEDQSSGETKEVPDWTIYGDKLETLSSEEQDDLRRRDIDIEGFLAWKVILPTDNKGRRKYKRLYV